MKLKSLTIQGYKNLENITIDFSTNNGISLLVGNNGCGKSNILEAISAIFAGLYKDRKFKPTFDYQLDYEVNGHEVNISLHGGAYHISVDSKSLSKSEFSANVDNLPTNLIACYSGESMRLWDAYYGMYYRDYIESIKKSTNIPRLPLVYINKYALEFALLVLYSFDFTVFTDIADFCQRTLGIKSLRNITIIFNDSQKIKTWPTNEILNFVMALCKVDEMSKIPSQIDISLEEYKENIAYLQNRERDLFFFLFGACMPKEDKIITNIILDLELHNGATIRVNDLSEGEKKNILITTILEVLADENSLILLDEPDSHIHISRKQALKETIVKYSNRESVWTTHSPTLASAFEESNHIVGLGVDENNKTRIISKSTADLIAELTNGIWNIHQQNVFLSSNKPMTVLVEGKTDKIILEQAFKKLKHNYPSLNFDIFHCSGADNIPQLMLGLKTSDISWGKKKIIAIFDSDHEGVDGCNKTQAKYNKSRNKKGLYAFILPKSNATIENFFPDQKFHDAYEASLIANPFTGSISEFSHNLMNKAKIKLSEDCKAYGEADFMDFEKIFDILNEINGL